MKNVNKLAICGLLALSGAKGVRAEDASPAHAELEAAIQAAGQFKMTSLSGAAGGEGAELVSVPRRALLVFPPRFESLFRTFTAPYRNDDTRFKCFMTGGIWCGIEKAAQEEKEAFLAYNGLVPQRHAFEANGDSDSAPFALPDGSKLSLAADDTSGFSAYSNWVNFSHNLNNADNWQGLFVSIEDLIKAWRTGQWLDTPVGTGEVPPNPTSADERLRSFGMKYREMHLQRTATVEVRVRTWTGESDRSRKKVTIVFDGIQVEPDELYGDEARAFREPIGSENQDEIIKHWKISEPAIFSVRHIEFHIAE